MTFKVTLTGFKTKEQAKEFLKWYEGGGEQEFYDHLDIVGKNPDDGCTINIHRKGFKRITPNISESNGCYYDELVDGYLAEVR
jgi:hypothetical protein